MPSVTDLPALNATLNFTSGLLIGIGVYFIRQKKIQAHRACMLSALSVSALFLISYLFYHYQVGSVRFAQEGWIRTLYLSILLTHTVLAAVIVDVDQARSPRRQVFAARHVVE